MINRTVLLLAILVFIAALASPRAALADRDHGTTLVGAWEVSVYPFASLCGIPSSELGDPAAVDITVVGRDGTVSNSDSFFGTGHGIWRRLEGKTHEMKFKTPILARPLLGIGDNILLTVKTTNLVLATGGMEACGAFEGFFVPAHPLFGDYFAGTVVFKRFVLSGNE